MDRDAQGHWGQLAFGITGEWPKSWARAMMGAPKHGAFSGPDFRLNASSGPTHGVYG